MCLFVQSRKKTSKEDFYVFKIVKRVTKTGYFSYYRDTEERFGEIQFSRFSFGNSQYGGKTISRGLHSYYLPKGVNYPGVYYDQFDILPHLSIILCCIPKDSNYYLGGGNQIASNQLIALEPLVVSNGSSLKLEVKTKKIKSFGDALMLAQKIALSYNFNLNPS